MAELRLLRLLISPLCKVLPRDTDPFWCSTEEGCSAPASLSSDEGRGSYPKLLELSDSPMYESLSTPEGVPQAVIGEKLLKQSKGSAGGTSKVCSRDGGSNTIVGTRGSSSVSVEAIAYCVCS